MQLHLLTGDPHGVKILRRAGWDGYVLAVPRADVETARGLEELNKGATVILLGSTTDNRPRVRVGHANRAIDHLPMFLADQRWTQLFALGREGDFPKVLARRIALSMTEAARRTKLADVVDAYPTAPKEISAAVRAEADVFSRETLTFLALCGVTVFGTSIPTTPASIPAESPAPVASTSAAETASTSVAATPTPSRPRPTTNMPTAKRMPVVSSRSTGKAHYDEDILLLLDLGLLHPGQKLIFEQPRKHRRHIAFVEPDGGIRFQNIRYGSPSYAAVAAAGYNSNGWMCWRTADGRLLDNLRKQARKRKG
ncbi:hypothetical protein A5780_28245 [Nocardia sp. 852002-20019_SCH5090214]|nr:hypothetical protein A5780_28245 [Nocardia sp. 852002-20019_SCH5090214]